MGIGTEHQGDGLEIPGRSSRFSITTATTSVALAQGRQGRVNFTVTNMSGVAARGRGVLVPVESQSQNWLRVEGKVDREFSVNGTETFLVHVDPPLGTAPGRYSFRLDVVWVDAPDEETSRGPTCEFTVPSVASAKRASKGYLATVVGASVGGLAGELLILVPALLRGPPEQTSPAGGDSLGQVIGQALGEFALLAVLLAIGVVLLYFGAVIGSFVGLRVREYLGSKTTALLLGVVMVPWMLVALLVLGHLPVGIGVLVFLAPIVVTALPALLARGIVLLVRTRSL